MTMPYGRVQRAYVCDEALDLDVYLTEISRLVSIVRRYGETLALLSFALMAFRSQSKRFSFAELLESATAISSACRSELSELKELVTTKHIRGHVSNIAPLAEARARFHRLDASAEKEILALLERAASELRLSSLLLQRPTFDKSACCAPAFLIKGTSMWTNTRSGYLNTPSAPFTPSAVFYYGEHNKGTMKLPFSYVLIKGRDGVALVDVGYDPTDFGGEIAQSIGVTNWTSPETVLAQCGVRPDEVTHIFLTHAHFDHIGGLRYFPAARIFIQQKELDSWTSLLSKGPRFRSLLTGLNPADVICLVRANIEGRLELIDGFRENVLPNIDLHPAHDTHTAGSQYVVVRGPGGSDPKFVLSGDVIYTHKNLLGDDPDRPYFVPPGLANGSQTKLVETAAEMMHQVDDDHRRVIPVHDEKLSDIYPLRLAEYGLKIIEINLSRHEQSRI